MTTIAASCPSRPPGPAARGTAFARPRATAPVAVAMTAATPETPREPTDPAAKCEALVRRSQAGSLEAFDELVERHGAAVFNYLCRLTGNPHDAEDLAQETFLKAHRGLARFQSARAFVPWLFTIARRTALNHFRAHRSTEPLPDTLAAPDEHASPAERTGRTDLSASVWQVARQLKPRQHEVLWLHYGEDLDIAQIASIMRTTRLNVRVLLHRARRELRRFLRQCAWADELPGAASHSSSLPRS